MILEALSMSFLNSFKDVTIKGILVEYMKSTTILNTISVYHVFKTLVLLIPVLIVPGALKLMGVSLGKIIEKPMDYKKLIMGFIIIACVEISITYPFFYGVTGAGLYILAFTATVTYLMLNTAASVFLLGEKINKQILVGIVIALSGIFVIVHGSASR